MRNIRKILVVSGLLCSVFCLSLLVSTGHETHPPLAYNAAPAQPASQESPCIMTVFLHGTVSPHVSFGAIGGWIKNLFRRRDKSVGLYQQYIEQVKRHSLHRFQPINCLGLWPIPMDESVNRKHQTYFGHHTARLYKKVYDSVYKDHADELRFYTFGWTGRLSTKSRRQSATRLYEAIVEEKKRLQEETGKPVVVWLLGHSHGANVILHLEEEWQDRQKNLANKNVCEDYLVDKAILVGGPVQSETEKLIVQGCALKEVYHIFSRGDHVQIVDCVSTRDFFSRRTFGADKNNPVQLPDHFRQIDVRIGNLKPFHYELWLWARKRFPYMFYRRRLQLYPLPVSVFAPALVQLTDSLDLKNDARKLCVAKFNKYSGSIVVRGGGQECSHAYDIEGLAKEGHDVL